MIFSFLTNKHLVIALIVAPILAVISYFSVDYMVSEKPQAAVAGGSYPLVAQSNCRYTSGQCTLRNGDIQLQLKFIDENRFVVESSAALKGGYISFVSANEENPNEENALNSPLQASGDEALQWYVNVNRNLSANAILRLAVKVEQSTYFAETVTVFKQSKTILDERLVKN